MTTTPRRRTIAVDEDAVATVLEGLRMEAERRKRVATRLAGEVIDNPDGKADQRPDALRIARFLATASRLETVADLLDAAEPVDAATITITADTGAAAADLTAAADMAAELKPPTPPTTTTDEPDEDEAAEALAAMGMTEETST